MALSKAVDSPAAPRSEAPSALQENAGRITALIGILIGIIVVAMVVLIAQHKQREGIKDANRKAWDLVYHALEKTGEADDPLRARIAGLEEAWTQVSGTLAHPWVMAQLGQAHFEMYTRAERGMDERKKNLERAREVFTVLNESHANHALYGPIGASGLADCLDEEGKYDEIIAVLDKSVRAHKDHYLYPVQCYKLARAFWLRSRAGDGTLSPEDADRARTLLESALGSESEEGQEHFAWRRHAQLLRSLLAPHGAAWPKDEPPPKLEAPAPPPEPEAAPGPAEAPPKAPEAAPAEPAPDPKTP